MGCCPSSAADDAEDADNDAPRSTRKQAKAKILTVEPSHIELDERTCDFSRRPEAYEPDEDLLARAEAEAAARRRAEEGRAEEELARRLADQVALEAARKEAAAKAEREAEEKARQAAEAEARREAEEKARREAAAAEQARLTSLTAAIGGTVARKKAVAQTRVEKLSKAAASSLDERAALSAFTKYEDSVQQAAAQLLARLPALARLGRRQPNKGAPTKADLGSLASLLSMEEHTRNAQFMSVMHAGASSQEHMSPIQVNALRSYVKHCSAMLDKLMSRIPLMPADVAPSASGYLSAVSQHRDLARAALSV